MVLRRARRHIDRAVERFGRSQAIEDIVPEHERPPQTPLFRRKALLGICVGLSGVSLFVRYLWPAMAALIIGGAVYALFAPLVDRLARARVPRSASAVGLLLALLGSAVLGVSMIVPRVYHEFRDLVFQLPMHSIRFDSWLRQQGLLGEEADPLINRAIGTLSGDLQSSVTGAMTWVLGQLTALFGSVLTFVLGSFMGLYLLEGGQEVRAALPGWFPPERRALWCRFGRRAAAVLTAYVRARILASVFIGLSYWAAFAVGGIQQPALLGLIGGVLNLVPVIGPILALAPAVLVAAFTGLTQVILVVIVSFVAQQIESGVIGPLLEGRFVRLPPIAIVISATLGSALLGVAGLLIAVPLAAVTRTALLTFYRDTWKESGDDESDG
jgi:predicted PurR-regulated permease PerM